MNLSLEGDWSSCGEFFNEDDEKNENWDLIIKMREVKRYITSELRKEICVIEFRSLYEYYSAIVRTEDVAISKPIAVKTLVWEKILNQVILKIKGKLNHLFIRLHLCEFDTLSQFSLLYKFLKHVELGKFVIILSRIVQKGNEMKSKESFLKKINKLLEYIDINIKHHVILFETKELRISHIFSSEKIIFPKTKNKLEKYASEMKESFLTEAENDTDKKSEEEGDEVSGNCEENYEKHNSFPEVISPLSFFEKFTKPVFECHLLKKNFDMLLKSKVPIPERISVVSLLVEGGIHPHLLFIKGKLKHLYVSLLLCSLSEAIEQLYILEELLKNIEAEYFLILISLVKFSCKSSEAVWKRDFTRIKNTIKERFNLKNYYFDTNYDENEDPQFIFSSHEEIMNEVKVFCEHQQYNMRKFKKIMGILD